MDKNSANITHERIALYGGAFDPVHNAHLRVAQYALDSMRLSKLVFVPSAQSPLKAQVVQAEAEFRFAMLELALNDFPLFEVDRSELEAGGLSFTIHTVRQIRQRYPDAELFWIIGSDQYAQINRWYAIEELVELIDFIVLKRPGFELPEKCPVPNMRVHLLETPLMRESSTEIRSLIQAGKSIAEWVPAPVLAFIDRRGLYKS